MIGRSEVNTKLFLPVKKGGSYSNERSGFKEVQNNYHCQKISIEDKHKSSDSPAKNYVVSCNNIRIGNDHILQENCSVDTIKREPENIIPARLNRSNYIHIKSPGKQQIITKDVQKARENVINTYKKLFQNQDLTNFKCKNFNSCSPVKENNCTNLVPHRVKLISSTESSLRSGSIMAALRANFKVSQEKNSTKKGHKNKIIKEARSKQADLEGFHKFFKIEKVDAKEKKELIERQLSLGLSSIEHDNLTKELVDRTDHTPSNSSSRRNLFWNTEYINNKRSMEIEENKAIAYRNQLAISRPVYKPSGAYKSCVKDDRKPSVEKKPTNDINSDLCCVIENTNFSSTKESSEKDPLICYGLRKTSSYSPSKITRSRNKTKEQWLVGSARPKSKTKIPKTIKSIPVKTRVFDSAVLENNNPCFGYIQTLKLNHFKADNQECLKNNMNILDSKMKQDSSTHSQSTIAGICGHRSSERSDAMCKFSTNMYDIKLPDLSVSKKNNATQCLFYKNRNSLKSPKIKKKKKLLQEKKTSQKSSGVVNQIIIFNNITINGESSCFQDENSEETAYRDTSHFSRSKRSKSKRLTFNKFRMKL
ncbi:unnamed protein product [Moneuplotes crassus]|uniref:Uncharacterized protein n=1 Tax=Euplotes crassus TaxID=5936 RepID=A0AAD2DBS9_EUPCR|nr:unnamed protein product [Moneuplotes crassus]